MPRLPGGPARDLSACQANHDLVVAQVGPRHLLPDHHSTAARAAHLGTVRDNLDARSFVLRNQRRTTLALGLVRIHLNGTDNPRRYTELLRSWLTANAGVAPAQRTGYDAGTGNQLPQQQRAASTLRS